MTLLYQLELDQTAVNCGASFVIQLNDGSFFLIDGGYFTPGEEDRLYQFLRDRSTGTPLIRGWFFSHAHQDHVGNFINFVRTHGPDVRIEQMLYNFHPVDLADVSGDWKSSDPATIKEFYLTVKACCAEIEQVTPRAGDRFEFDELAVDIIYTQEDLYPGPASFNDYSTVLRTTVGGCSTLWLGDAGAKAAAVLLQKPEYLQCDIVQIAHHGIDNAEILKELYGSTGASVALWPTPDYGMEARKDQAVNQFLLRDCGIQEHLVSGYGTAALPLPYSPGRATKCAKALTFDRQPEPAEFVSDGVDASTLRYLTPLPVEPKTS